MHDSQTKTDNVETPPEAKAGSRGKATRREPPLPFKPFPVAVLPGVMRQFVDEGAAAIGCDPSFVALPLLSAVAATVGNTRTLRLKDDWEEPAILWTCIVGESGTAKTPAQNAALEPLHRAQAEMFEAHKEDMRSYFQADSQYAADLAEWKKPKKGVVRGPAPEKPDPPECRRVVVSDTTPEALAPILQANWRGVLLARDELAGWLSFDQYNKGKGGDVPKWLSIFGAGNMIIDRKTGLQRTTFVPRANVSITGGVQPMTLRQALGRERFQDGLVARLLLAMPPPRVRRWTEATISRPTKVDLESLVLTLRDLKPDADSKGSPIPHPLRKTPSGKAAWVTFDDAHLAEAAGLADDDLPAAWAKLEAYAARLALVIHLARVASGETVEDAEAVDGASMAAAVALVDWFKNETRRVYAMCAGGDDGRKQDRLVNLIKLKGGSVTAHDIRSAFHGDSAAAEAALNGLVKAGRGFWEPVPSGPQGGRPTSAFRLHSDAGQNQNPEKPQENEGFGFGSCVREPEMEEGEI